MWCRSGGRRTERRNKPFVYAIRCADHCPEGLLTIDSDAGDGALEQPLQSIVSVSHAKAPLFFSLGAATRAALLGERYLHGAILHQFSHQTDASLRLTARARQFSSFVLLVGKIASADTFEPTHATIVQNKDDVLIPLLLEQIPSAKAFRDAIESLSPEQQRFAKAFRVTQLEIDAVCGRGRDQAAARAPACRGQGARRGAAQCASSVDAAPIDDDDEAGERERRWRAAPFTSSARPQQITRSFI